MMGLYNDLAKSYIGFNDLNSALVDTKNAFNSLGETGVSQLTDWMQSLKNTEANVGSFNMSNEQMAHYTLQNLKAQKAYGAFDTMNKAQQAQSMKDYIDSLNTYSHILGMSTDELSAKLAESVNDVNGMNYKMVLLSRGFSEQDAAKAAEGYNLVNSSLGTLGNELQKQMETFTDIGTVDANSPLYNLLGTPVGKAMQQYSEMMKSGALATDKGRQAAVDLFAKNKDLIKFLNSNSESGPYRRADAALNQFLTTMQVELQNASSKVNKRDYWADAVTGVNKTIDNYVGSFKNAVGSLLVNPQATLESSSREIGSLGVSLTGEIRGYLGNMSNTTKNMISSVFGPQWEKWVDDTILKPFFNFSKELNDDPSKAIGDFIAKVKDFGSKMYSRGEELFTKVGTIYDKFMITIDNINEILDKVNNYSNMVLHPIDTASGYVSDAASSAGAAIKSNFNDLSASLKSVFQWNSSNSSPSVQQNPVGTSSYQGSTPIQGASTSGSSYTASTTQNQPQTDIDQAQELKKISEILGKIFNATLDGNAKFDQFRVN